MMTYFILLLFYAALTLIFISLNIFHPQKCLNYICLSHILGIITIVCFTINKLEFHSVLFHAAALFFFLWSIFFGFISANSFTKIKFSAKYIYAYIIFIIIDIFFSITFSPISTFLNKIMLMSIFIFLGIYMLIKNNKSISQKFLGIIMISFALIQVFFGFIKLFIIKEEFFIDLVFYIVQSMVYSFGLIFTVIEDIYTNYNDNKKLLREAYDLHNLKNEFITNISHELRTPINIIYSSLQVIELNIDDYKNNNDKLSYYIKIMKQNCFRLLKLTNNLIDLNKIKAKALELHLANYDIVCIVEDITLSVVPYAQQKNINIEFDTEFEEKLLACDAEKIERIMLNLLSNAIKFTNEGGQIQVYMTEKNDQVFISVNDNGIGIPQNMQSVIYNRYTQAYNKYDELKEGSGIGLSLVKSLVEMHNGKLTLTSNEGIGSCFTFSLPIKVIDKNYCKDQIIRKINIKNIEIEFSDMPQ